MHDDEGDLPAGFEIRERRRAAIVEILQEVTGTVAGDDIFVATASSRDQKKLLQRLRSFLS